MHELSGTVAIVTGASRSVGRGIALVLGEARATVYVTGRSTRSHATQDLPRATVEDTAEMVTARRRGHSGALRPHRRRRG
jgi:NAD(P)-dependent dehydrogenase (short-subunit alcohol dehydrogenase family)